MAAKAAAHAGRALRINTGSMLRQHVTVAQCIDADVVCNLHDRQDAGAKGHEHLRRPMCVPDCRCVSACVRLQFRRPLSVLRANTVTCFSAALHLISCFSGNNASTATLLT